MKHSAIVIAAGLALAAMLSAAPAQAQNARSFVSGHGLDSNACTLTAPCRTFAVAFTHTNAGGEIDVLDTAGYGPLTIDKAISIVNDGAVASVLVPFGGVGIYIGAGVSDAVSLRGLTIEGAGAGGAGIQFATGASLAVDNCVIRHLNGNGIYFLPNATSNLSVSNTLVADNGANGIFVVPSGSGAVTAFFNRVEAHDNSSGIVVSGLSSTGTVNASVSESAAAHNPGGFGFVAITQGVQAPTTLMLFHSVAANNGTGLSANGLGATIRVRHSTVTGNANGWAASSGGVLQSYGDNSIDGNGANETMPPSVGLK